MPQKPFQAKVPLKYLIETEDRKFWDYLIRYINDLRAEAGAAAINLDAINVSDLYGATEPPANEASDPYSSASSPESVRNEAVADGIIYGATNGDDVIAFNSATIILPDFPPIGALINVTQGDSSTTTVDSTGKAISGGSPVTFSIVGSQYGFSYSSITDTWNII